MKKIKFLYPAIFLLSLFFSHSSFAQASFDFRVVIEPVTIDGMDGLHSFAYAQLDGKWLLIAGRTDGIHARQPFNAFPANQNNKTIYVIDPISEEVWTASVENLPVALQEQLQSTNMQFYQDDSVLYFAGGYGFSVSEDDHITYPYLTAIDVPGLMEDVINGKNIASNFEQITDDRFAVTGGYLGKIGEEFMLVSGHRFDGRYNPMGHPTFVQEYTNQIRKFKINNNNGLSYSDYTAITDETNLHRRDLNLLPQIYPDGSFGYTIFSGVFQVNEDLPFLYPVDITAGGHTPQVNFNQLLCNYHTAHVSLYDGDENAMHNLFFGGISQYYFSNGTLVQDDNVPFVKTISRVSRDKDGNLEEVALPIEMPALLGASAEFFVNPDLPQLTDEIIKLDELPGDSVLLGYIVGGIESPELNPFSFNNSEVTFASNTIFKMHLVKEESTATAELVLDGYHDFKIETFPNPAKDSFFFIKAMAPETGSANVLLTDAQGKLVINEVLSGLSEGENLIEIQMADQKSGLYFVTVALNGKYFSSSKIVLEK